MKKRRYIGRLLLLVSMLVLIIPVLPHHHHAHSICVSNDIGETQHHHHTDPGCESTCITKLHFSIQQHHDDCVSPQTFELLSVFSEVFSFSLLPPHLDSFDELFYYIERLHGAGRLSITVLRAPPTF